MPSLDDYIGREPPENDKHRDLTTPEGMAEQVDEARNLLLEICDQNVTNDCWSCMGECCSCELMGNIEAVLRQIRAHN